VNQCQGAIDHYAPGPDGAVVRGRRAPGAPGPAVPRLLDRLPVGLVRIELVAQPALEDASFDLLPSATGELSHRVKRRLDRDLAVRYDLGALAADFHVSTRTLLRRFRAETGLTPLGYLHTARIRRARHLLESTDRTAASIAAEVGYDDPGSFTGVFARHTTRLPQRLPAGHGDQRAVIARLRAARP
jgi:AraC-like DNA-binding protein